MGIQKLNIDFEISENARTAVVERILSSGINSPVVGLIWGKWNDETEQHWSIGFYEKEKISDGWMFEVAGLTFYMYQDFIFDKLEGKTLDIIEGKIVIE